MSLRWGLIGCGDIVRKRVAAALSKGTKCQLTAVSRARKELAIEFAKEYDASPFADWRQMVASSEIDAVYIATPVHVHAEQAIEAARRGKHVLCEKPMAMSAEECDQMIAECKQAGVKLGVAYYRHFYPVIRRLRTMVESGVIGKPVLARAEAFERFDPLEGGERSWLLDPELSGGGPMMDFGCHRIEILLHLLGPLSSVTAFRSNIHFLERRVEDTMTASFLFRSGTQAVVIASHAPLQPRDSFHLFCTDGSAHIDVLNSGKLRLVSPQGTTEESHPPPANLHQPLIEDFASAVLDDRPPRVDGNAGRAVSAALDQIYSRQMTDVPTN
jgi:predicted dehydrogenase